MYIIQYLLYHPYCLKIIHEASYARQAVLFLGRFILGNTDQKSGQKLNPCFSPLSTWAFSIGTSIGWGSFVVTCNTYLSQAGVAGTILGTLLGMAIILVINHNLCYIMENNPSAGGLYTFCGNARNKDTGFMVAWFLLLTYLAVLWANITSLPLFSKRFLGRFFQFGFSYSVFGYTVYLGEALLSIAAICLTGFLLCRSRRIPQIIMMVMAVFFVAALAAVTVYALASHQAAGLTFEPAYIPDKNELGQIIRIAVISPWAFIGFENAAHFSEEFAFPLKKIRRVMLSSVILTTVFYILMTVLSVSAFPPEYANWLEYVHSMDKLRGVKSIPAFYAADHYLGSAGVTLMLLALLAVIITSMIGNLTAISRLLFAFGRDHEWAGGLAKLNAKSIPANAVIAATGVSCLIPFLGRTAIGWIVDVTTLGATIIYGFLSYSVMWDAKLSHKRTEFITGAVGSLLMVGNAVLLLAPKLISYEAMAAESYLLFAAWSMLGIFLFRYVVLKDRQNKYGHSVIVWVMLLLLMLLTTMMWMNRETQLVTKDSMYSVKGYYASHTIRNTLPEKEAEEAFLESQADRIENAEFWSTFATFVLFIIAVSIMTNNFAIARRRQQELEEKLGIAREIGYTDALTGIKNKYAYTLLENKVDKEIDDRDCAPFAVVVCDINDLKIINDVKGHVAGDERIREASRFICRVFSHSPVYRYGGDEFVVFLRGEDYDNRTELKKMIDSSADENQGSDRLVIATGMEDYNTEIHKSLLRVFEQADQKMYERKKMLKGMK